MTTHCDRTALVEHCAKQLATAMNAIRPGNWEVHISHELGYSLIVDREVTKEMEGPLRSDEVTGTIDFADFETCRRAQS